MSVTTAPAPPNPISAVTFTGFSFAPRRKFYNVFKYGTLAKLAVRPCVHHTVSTCRVLPGDPASVVLPC